MLIKEWERIKGVKSSSAKTPFRQSGFPEEYASFEGATSYDKWEFVFVPKKQTNNTKKTNQNGETPAANGRRPGT